MRNTKFPKKTLRLKDQIYKFKESAKSIKLRKKEKNHERLKMQL